MSSPNFVLSAVVAQQVENSSPKLRVKSQTANSSILALRFPSLTSNRRPQYPFGRMFRALLQIVAKRQKKTKQDPLVSNSNTGSTILVHDVWGPSTTSLPCIHQPPYLVQSSTTSRTHRRNSFRGLRELLLRPIVLGSSLGDDHNRHSW